MKSSHILTIIVTFLSILCFAPYLSAGSGDKTISYEPITSMQCNRFTFDASGSHDPDDENISIYWDFGDGENSTEPVITHTYRKSGDYTVTLSITDNSGLECSTALTKQMVRVNLPPHVEFEAAGQTCVNQEIVFDGSASYDDNASGLSYLWEFGDGTSARNQKVVRKSYKKGGDYEVRLTVDDNSGSVCNTKNVVKTIRINEPPVAEAGEEEILKCVTSEHDMTVSFDASSSLDSNKDQLRYFWEFGDGVTAEGKQVQHKYADVGNYDVKLIVKDGAQLSCSTAVDFVNVRLNKTAIAKAGLDITACPGDTISFDGSESYIHKKGTAISKWAFGDGTSANGLVASHVYKQPGQYQASLEIANALNAMCPVSRDTRIVNINSRPSVSIKAVESICLGTKVHFDATSAEDADGDKLEYYWSFGDGTVLRAGSKVFHEYKQGGTYRATVVVDDTRETACSTATASVNVKVNTPPIADAGTNLSCCVDKEATFNASASSDPDSDYLTYTWDFGDGTTMNGAVVTHSYAKSGSYNVRLTVDDNSGTACSTSNAGFRAEVNAAPVPVINIR